MREMLEELRRIADDLKRHAGTNEMHILAELADRLYHLAIEVKRIDDIISHKNDSRAETVFRNRNAKA